MVTNKEHPHNELSKEEVELKIEELVKKYKMTMRRFLMNYPQQLKQIGMPY